MLILPTITADTVNVLKDAAIPLKFTIFATFVLNEFALNDGNVLPAYVNEPALIVFTFSVFKFIVLALIKFTLNELITARFAFIELIDATDTLNELIFAYTKELVVKLIEPELIELTFNNAEVIIIVFNVLIDAADTLNELMFAYTKELVVKLTEPELIELTFNIVAVNW